MQKYMCLVLFSGQKFNLSPQFYTIYKKKKKK